MEIVKYSTQAYKALASKLVRQINTNVTNRKWPLCDVIDLKQFSMYPD